MKFRKLQRLNEREQWEDHGYAYEREDGRASFRYNNLVLGRIGAQYNVRLREAKTPLKDVHQVIPATKRLRWLEIEEIDGDPETIKARLDEACQIPRPLPLDNRASKIRRLPPLSVPPHSYPLE